MQSKRLVLLFRDVLHCIYEYMYFYPSFSWFKPWLKVVTCKLSCLVSNVFASWVSLEAMWQTLKKNIIWRGCNDECACRQVVIYCQRVFGSFYIITQSSLSLVYWDTKVVLPGAKCTHAGRKKIHWCQLCWGVQRLHFTASNFPTVVWLQNPHPDPSLSSIAAVSTPYRLT